MRLPSPNAPNEPGDNNDGNGYSASVSVSVSSPAGLLRLAGLPDRLNTLTVSSPASFSAKCTRGVLGALWALECLRVGLEKSPTTFGEEEEDLREGFSGRPLARMIGVLGVRGIETDEAEVDRERRDMDGVSGRKGERVSVGDRGEDLGKGTLDVVDPLGDTDEGDGGVSAVVVAGFGSSMCVGGDTLGEKRPCCIERRRELRGVSSTVGWAWGEVEGEWSSSGGESSSTDRWKTAFLLDSELGRRRGREPREVNAPGPRSSLKDERVRRWAGRTWLAEEVVAVWDEEEDGSAGYAYGMAVRRGWSCGQLGEEGCAVTGKGRYDSREVSISIVGSELWEIPEEIPEEAGG